MKPLNRLLLLFICIAFTNMAWAQTCNPNIKLTKLDSRYVNHGDGTVTDTVTNLMWMQCSLGLTGADCATRSENNYKYFWRGALKAAQTANQNNLLGYSDWRLPNIKELHSLVESACYTPAINTHLFPNTLSAGYWTASPYANYSKKAWQVHFFFGLDSYSSKSDLALSVRLVRTDDTKNREVTGRPGVGEGRPTNSDDVNGTQRTPTASSHGRD